MTQRLIGISGKIGSGKNWLADRLIEQLEAENKSAQYASFAVPLREEMKSLIRAFATGQSLESIASEFNIPLEKLEYLYSLLADDIAEQGEDLDPYTRTEAMRRALQYLGSDVRRVQDDQYWINKFFPSIPTDVDYIFITDVRFPNEADALIDNSGVLLRLDIPEEIILDRTKNRDGLVYSKEALSHQSETALDDYSRFTFTVGADFEPKKVLEQIHESY